MNAVLTSRISLTHLCLPWFVQKFLKQEKEGQIHFPSLSCISIILPGFFPYWMFVLLFTLDGIR